MREWYTQDDGIMSYVGNSEEVIFPAFTKTKKLEWINAYACSPLKDGLKEETANSRRNIKKVVVPEGIETICEHAFDGCENLESVILPGSIERICEYAFQNCKKLRFIDLKGSTIEEGCFYGCKSLETVLGLGCNCHRVPVRAFSGCASLKSIDLPEGLWSLEFNSFGGCASLESIEIPSTVTRMESDCLAGCKSLTTIRIPDGVKEIKHGTFAGCEKLQNIRLHLNIKKIESAAFSGCKSLQEIIIPAITESIGSGAFLGCSGFQCVEIPENVKSLYSDAFFGCNNLVTITIKGKETQINDSPKYDWLSNDWIGEGRNRIPRKLPDETGFPKNIEIIAPKGSIAEDYAKKYNLKFSELKKEELN